MMSMPYNLSVSKAFESAGRFLSPVLKRDEIQQSHGGTLIEKLGRGLQTEGAGSIQERDLVLGEALSLLKDIHTAFSRQQRDNLSLADVDTADSALEDAKRRKVLNALLDLISLEGIYPAVSPGIAVPLEKRVISALPTGVVARKVPFSKAESVKFNNLLKTIIDTLLEIIFDDHAGIQPIVLARILSDILSGLAELAFQQHSLEAEEKATYERDFEKIIDETPTTTLLPILSSFLRPDAAPWFQKIISNRISRVPLRNDGVVQTIFFVAAQFAPSLGQNEQGLTSNGPPITVQAIMQLSKLLSSVPEGMDSTTYFSNIGPQLLTLIDGDDPDLKRTAAYVVGSGILGKKVFGAPSTIGHRIFVEPIFKTLTAELDDSSRTWLFSLGDNTTRNDRKNQGRPILVEAADLSRSVDRLSALTLQHPNPGLVKRLIHPVLLPLWALLGFAHESDMKVWHEKSFLLLQTYFSVSPGFQPFKKLVDNLLWKGGDRWTYDLDAGRDICLQTPEQTSLNIVDLMKSLETRINDFSRLLRCDPQSEERTCDVFLYVSGQWLSPISQQMNQNTMGSLLKGEDESEKIVRKLVSAKVTEKLLEDFKETLSRHPLKILQLVQQLLESEMTRVNYQTGERKDKSGKLSLDSLASIVDSSADARLANEQDKDSAESMSAAFSLLSTILASPEFVSTGPLQTVLQGIKSTVDTLLPNLPSSMARACTTASMLLEIHLTNSESEGKAKQQTKTPPLSDFETHRQVLVNISSSMPPVQAEGLSQLSSLIMKSSPVLDIPSTLNLLLSLITEQNGEKPANEEFIYLNAVSIIGVLASKHPRTVVRTLVDRYADQTEQSTVDQRLKIGESIMRTVQDLGDALVGEPARIIGEGMISVAGRRGRKPLAHKARLEQEHKKRSQREPEEKESAMPAGWKITSSVSHSDKTTGTSNHLLERNYGDDSDTETTEQAAHSASILSAWTAGSSADQEPDDLRLRASALSILATAIQINMAAIGPSIVTSAVDLALSVLSVEPGPESAILRRASAVLLLDLIKAIDYIRETRGANALGFGFSLTDPGSSSSNTQDANARGPTTIGNIPTILRTLAFVESKETDAVVRGHLRVLLESFEAWMEKSLIWGIAAHGQGGVEQDIEPRLNLSGRIAGLDIDPLAAADRKGKKAVIEEIE